MIGARDALAGAGTGLEIGLPASALHTQTAHINKLLQSGSLAELGFCNWGAAALNAHVRIVADIYNIQVLEHYSAAEVVEYSNKVNGY